MTATNRTALALVRETTLGTTPTTPRMRSVRFTGDSLSAKPDFISSDEIRPDRMQFDSIKVMQASSGNLNFEMHYPEDNDPLSEIIRNAMFSAWNNSPAFYNDGVAD